RTGRLKGEDPSSHGCRALRPVVDAFGEVRERTGLVPLDAVLHFAFEDETDLIVVVPMAWVHLRAVKRLPRLQRQANVVVHDGVAPTAASRRVAFIAAAVAAATGVGILDRP